MEKFIEYTKPYTAIAVANELISRAKEKNIEITHLKLQKLVYFAHALHLALNNTPLISDEVQAWKYGPVIPTLFKECAVYGKKPINKPIPFMPTENITNFWSPSLIPNFINVDDVDSHALLDAIISEYGHKSAIELSNIAHSSNSAWSATKEEHQDGERRNYVIPIEIIATAEKRRFGIRTSSPGCTE